MYTEALETSADAAGTLQKQQDIYMESVEAHLEQLTASTEGLYKELFNTDEIIPLIDALADIVKGANEMTAAFGGGIKSLAGFAAMYTNLFQKSINQDITRIVSNKDIAVHNAKELQMKAEVARSGVAVGEEESFEDQATRLAVEGQIENANRLAAVSKQLTEEDKQRVIELQNQSIELERQAKLLDLESDREYKSALDEGIEQGVITADDITHIEDAEKEGGIEAAGGEIAAIKIQHEEILDRLEEQTESLEKQLEQVNLEKQAYKDIEDTLDNIIANSSSKETKKELENSKALLKNNKATVKQKQEILNIAKKAVKEEKDNIKLLDKAEKSAEKRRKAEKDIEDKKNQSSGINEEIDKTLDPAEKAKPAVDIINTLTASVSALATT